MKNRFDNLLPFAAFNLKKDVLHLGRVVLANNLVSYLRFEEEMKVDAKKITTLWRGAESAHIQ